MRVFEPGSGPDDATKLGGLGTPYAGFLTRIDDRFGNYARSTTARTASPPATPRRMPVVRADVRGEGPDQDREALRVRARRLRRGRFSTSIDRSGRGWPISARRVAMGAACRCSYPPLTANQSGSCRTPCMPCTRTEEIQAGAAPSRGMPSGRFRRTSSQSVPMARTWARWTNKTPTTGRSLKSSARSHGLSRPTGSTDCVTCTTSRSCPPRAAPTTLNSELRSARSRMFRESSNGGHPCRPGRPVGGAILAPFALPAARRAHRASSGKAHPAPNRFLYRAHDVHGVFVSDHVRRGRASRPTGYGSGRR